MGILNNLVINQTAVLSNSYININTLFVVIIVLAVLLLVALAYLVNIMSYLKNNAANNGPVSSAGNTAVTQTAGSEQGELVNNNELVAVITAAIYASMGTDVPADGLVVRSIRKVNR